MNNIWTSTKCHGNPEVGYYNAQKFILGILWQKKAYMIHNPTYSISALIA
jgi:hypothetical protein